MHQLLAESDPFDPEAQRRIEEAIRSEKLVTPNYLILMTTDKNEC